MRKIAVFLFCFACCSALLLAQKEDYNWILGYPDDPTSPAPPYFGGTLLNFKNGQPDTVRFVTNAGTAESSSISDEQGNLLFYTNGCEVYDRNHHIMPNGDQINPGDAYEYSCQDLLKEYGMFQGIIVLPWPKHPHLYRVLHLRYIKNGHIANELLSSTVDMSLDENGVVTEKSQVVTSPDTLVLISAVRHANGTDWWVVIPKALSSKYYVFLLDSAGIHRPRIQNFEGFPYSGGACQAAFSPDGSLYAQGGNDGVNIFSFNRCTGSLCNPRKIPFDSTYAYEIFGGGVGFSPNSKYLYRVSGASRLYQYDLSAPNINDSRILIGMADNFIDPVGPIQRTFFNLGLGPDNKIYMPDGNSSCYWNTIHRPDEPGQACMFRQHDLLLPTFHRFAVPNFPNYRLGALEPACNNYQGGCATNDTVQDGSVRIFPNPAADFIRVTGAFPTASPPRIQIYDVLGRLLLEHRLRELPDEISIAHLPAAGYFYRVLTLDGQRIGSGLLIKAR